MNFQLVIFVQFLKEVISLHFLLISWLLYLNIKSRSWRCLGKVYPSLIYVTIFNGLYYFLCKNYLLWDLKDKYLSTGTLRNIHIFVINPLMVLYFLARVPGNFFMKGIYIVKKSLQSLMVEWMGNKLNMIYFDHGWNFGWSMMIYAKMYTFSLLILRRPLLTTILSIFTTICFLLTFNVPIQIQIKLRQFMKRLLRFYKLNRQFVLAALTVLVTLMALVRGRRKMNIFFWLLYTIGRMFLLPVHTDKVAWKQ